MFLKSKQLFVLVSILALLLLGSCNSSVSENNCIKTIMDSTNFTYESAVNIGELHNTFLKGVLDDYNSELNPFEFIEESFTNLTPKDIDSESLNELLVFSRERTDISEFIGDVYSVNIIEP